MKETLKYSITLFLICFVAGILLSLVYAVTEPRITQKKTEIQNSAIQEVLPQAQKIEEKEKDDFKYYLALGDQDKILGYVFICEAKGYSSVIKAAVSITPAGEIINIRVLEQNETPGIGSQVTGEKFLNGFKNKTSRDSIDAITGATISSSALIKSVQRTIEKILP
jgi:electron transport complex protein RnfG